MAFNPKESKLIKPGQPGQKPTFKAPRFPLLAPLLGKRVCIQERGSKAGAPLVVGRLTAIEGLLLRIEEVEIRGVRNVVRPAFVIVHISQIAHIHPEVAPVPI